jgi:hypothetical protein
MHLFRLLMAMALCQDVLVGLAQNSDIPSTLAVPAGSKLLLHAYAKGVQIYVCMQVPTDTGRYSWTLVAPEANLYSNDNYHQQVGKHYYSATQTPVWESTDGSKVEGSRLQLSPAPDSGAIPWLLLKASYTTGFGPLRSTTFIQRLHTKGGKAPPDGADRIHKGQSIRVAYTAEYLFYGDGKN